MSNAFPLYGRYDEEGQGMTLRDYFAAKAMVGYMTLCSNGQQTINNDTHLATISYALADAMMKARET